MTRLAAFEGKFQVWSHTVSHGQLLLRRCKEPTLEKRIDLLFRDVEAIQLPPLIEDLTLFEEESVRSPNLPDWMRACARLDGQKLFVLAGSRSGGYVLAGSASWMEDDGAYDEASGLLKGGLRG